MFQWELKQTYNASKLIYNHFQNEKTPQIFNENNFIGFTDGALHFFYPN